MQEPNFLISLQDRGKAARRATQELASVDPLDAAEGARKVRLEALLQPTLQRETRWRTSPPQADP
jgi:hypothetical protein